MKTKRNTKKGGYNKDNYKRKTRRSKLGGGTRKRTMEELSDDKLRELNMKMMNDALGQVSRPRKRAKKEAEENAKKEAENAKKEAEKAKKEAAKAKKETEKAKKEAEKAKKESEKAKKESDAKTSKLQRDYQKKQKVEVLIKKGMEYPPGSLQRAFFNYTIEDVESMDLEQLHNIYRLWRREEALRRKGHRMEKRGHTNTAPWSNEEENTLIELVPMYGNNWVEISAIMEDRSPQNIRKYWDKYLKGDYGKAPELHKPKTQKVKTQKVKNESMRTQNAKTQKTKTKKAKTQDEEDQEMMDDIISVIGEEDEIEKKHLGMDDTPKKMRMNYSGDVAPGSSIPEDLFGSKDVIEDERHMILNPPVFNQPSRNEEKLEMLEEIDEMFPEYKDYKRGGSRESKIDRANKRKRLIEKEKKRPLTEEEYEEWYEIIAEQELNSQLPYIRYLADYNNNK
jgi:hypothetical protein